MEKLGFDSKEIIQSEHAYLVQSYARPDFVLVRGEGMRLYDAEDKAYQDWVAGIAVNALGYKDAGIEAILKAQIETGLIHTSNLYHTVPHVQLAKALVEKSFADRVFFSNSGAEANEGALKFARRVAHNAGHADKREVLCFTNAFHGRTMGVLAITPKDKYQKPFAPMLPGALVGEYNNIESARALINSNTAAVIVEPIQGEGGIHVATQAFMQALRNLCDEHGALLIFDEIQCGMGRTGKLWAHEHLGVTPDIMTIAKPLAGGLPIGAILCTEAVASNIHAGDHGTTFGGGPLITQVANYVLERVSQPDFLAHVSEVGDYLQERLSELNSPLIAELRGQGLMMGIEFTVDVAPFVQAAYAHNLLLVNAGPNVIRLVPPLIAEKADVDDLVNKFTLMLEQHHA